MQDIRNPNSQKSDDPAPLSEALHIPTLVGEGAEKDRTAPRDDDPAPLSEALHIPTLVSESSQQGKATLDRNDPAPFSKALHIPTLIGETSREPETKDANTGAQDRARATTPAGSPRADSASPIGVPSNHPQTEMSSRLAKLDRAAFFAACVMTLGPLFAAMVGRMGH